MQDKTSFTMNFVIFSKHHMYNNIVVKQNGELNRQNRQNRQ